MELNSGDDLISLKESIRGHYSPSIESRCSTINADQYARCNGLTIDSLLLDWKRLVEVDQAIISTIADVQAGHLIEAPQLQECIFRVIIPTTEQWRMPAASLKILQQVCRRCKDDELADWVSQQCFNGTFAWSSLKLETPALRSDHGTDCRRLTRRVNTFLKESLPDHRLPLHPVDITHGEGVEFPGILLQRDAEEMKAIEHETLEVTKNTLVYLMQSLKSGLTDKDHWDFVGTGSPYQGVGALEHLTPPLSPLAVAYPECFVPEDETCELPQPCDPISTPSQDIAAAEKIIFEDEVEFWANTLENNDSPGRYDDIDISEMIRAGEFRLPIPPSSPQPVPRDLKIDVPLLARSDDVGNALESGEVLEVDDLAGAKELIASSDTLSGSDGPTGQLVSAFQKSAATVMRHAEQEKLQPLDATTRVPIPVLDFTIPVPEWEQRLWEAKAMFRLLREESTADWQCPKWPHNRAAEQKMVWVPIAHIKEKSLVSEHIEVDTEVLEVFLRRSGDCDVLTSADCVYKEPGPMVLRMGEEEDDDDEECLMPLHLSTQTSPTNFRGPASGATTPTPKVLSTPALQHNSSVTVGTTMPPPADLTSLLGGRKRLIDETLHRRQPSAKRDRVSAASSDISATGIIDGALIPSTNVLRGFMSEYTDFAPLVDNFLEMNFPKKLKLTHSSFFSPPDTTPSSSRSKEQEAARLMPPPPKPIPALAPPIRPPPVAPRIVISTTVSRPLTQHLQTLLPTIELIPRDYAKHRPPNQNPGLRPPDLEEADIIVSPATGILLTTMVQLRQRALPGSGSNNSNSSSNSSSNSVAATGFCRVVGNVAARHARVVVLVSEGNRHSETAGPLSPSDARALAEFQGFAAGLKAAEVRVVYVGGGVETLARWVAAMVCEYVGEAAGVADMLLPVETLWEVFLRRAGMNVFAAQVVLGSLKVPDGRPAVGGGDGQMFGLPLFVSMSRERRVELFGEVLGGRGVLDRVSDALDDPWGQRAVDGGSLDSRAVPSWGGF
ncbi:uncharacterized protein B0H64DRAFT_475801 [Chaetomium fimeti]|uniref:Uncharacterized protein n=1 Tax=Chaetomium fimeti TaxID=1854472 RepID=A0AAE0HER2_9PEZI|nr:hypothetical protein B0H64DRAFT_475801 [Chaetomium fimeti]